MSIYGIRMAIQTVEKELYELEYSITKEEIRNHGSNVFILTENIVKELVHIYGYLLYGENYENKLNIYKNVKRLMFGEALNVLINISNNSKNTDILTKLNRNYLVFDIEDSALNNLRKCSKVRGKIFHEYGLDIQSLKEYKEEVKSGIISSFLALKKLQEDEIFPNIMEFDSILKGKEKDRLYFRDEINSRIPMVINHKDQEYIKNTQWYIFKNSDLEVVIPVKNKIHIMSEDTVEPKVIDIKVNECKTKNKWGHLDIVGKDTVDIDKNKIFIGRLITNDIQFTNRSISRRQCVIEVIGDKVYIVDLDSTFGTYLNGVKLVSRERTLIREYDEICIGKGIERIRIIYRN